MLSSVFASKAVNKADRQPLLGDHTHYTFQRALTPSKPLHQRFSIRSGLSRQHRTPSRLGLGAHTSVPFPPGTFGPSFAQVFGDANGDNSGSLFPRQLVEAERARTVMGAPDLDIYLHPHYGLPETVSRREAVQRRKDSQRERALLLAEAKMRLRRHSMVAPQFEPQCDSSAFGRWLLWQRQQGAQVEHVSRPYVGGEDNTLGHRFTASSDFPELSRLSLDTSGTRRWMAQVREFVHSDFSTSNRVDYEGEDSSSPPSETYDADDDNEPSKIHLSPRERLLYQAACHYDTSDDTKASVRAVRSHSSLHAPPALCSPVFGAQTSETSCTQARSMSHTRACGSDTCRISSPVMEKALCSQGNTMSSAEIERLLQNKVLQQTGSGLVESPSHSHRLDNSAIFSHSLRDDSHSSSLESSESGNRSPDSDPIGFASGPGRDIPNSSPCAVLPGCLSKSRSAVSVPDTPDPRSATNHIYNASCGKHHHLLSPPTRFGSPFPLHSSSRSLSPGGASPILSASCQYDLNEGTCHLRHSHEGTHPGNMAEVSRLRAGGRSTPRTIISMPHDDFYGRNSYTGTDRTARSSPTRVNLSQSPASLCSETDNFRGCRAGCSARNSDGPAFMLLCDDANRPSAEFVLPSSATTPTHIVDAACGASVSNEGIKNRLSSPRLVYQRLRGNLCQRRRPQRDPFSAVSMSQRSIAEVSGEPFRAQWHRSGRPTLRSAAMPGLASPQRLTKSGGKGSFFNVRMKSRASGQGGVSGLSAHPDGTMPPPIPPPSGAVAPQSVRPMPSDVTMRTASPLWGLSVASTPLSSAPSHLSSPPSTRRVSPRASFTGPLGRWVGRSLGHKGSDVSMRTAGSSLI